MNLAPLLNAPLVTQLHAYAALAAFALGVAQLAGFFTLAPGRIMSKVLISG